MLDAMTVKTAAEVRETFPMSKITTTEEEWAARVILREALAPFAEVALLLDSIDRRRSEDDFIHMPLRELRAARQAYNAAARIVGEVQL